MKKNKNKGETIEGVALEWMNIEQQSTTTIHQRIGAVCQIFLAPNAKTQQIVLPH